MAWCFLGGARQMVIPLYILIPLAVLAAVALIERILLPSVRVVMRRWLRGMTDDLNSRLRLKLQPFKMTRKRIVEEMLIHDPEVAHAAKLYREANQLSWDEVTDLVRVWAREIVPRFNVYLYYRPSHWIARGAARLLYRVRISFLDKRAMAAVDTEASVIFVMNHRSNFDYIIVSYIVSRLAAISYAVGEWARIWPLDALLRRMGAYFVRRKASDPLYRKVLERFVQLSAESGVTQGIFPEGRLTRDGRLGEPKLGLLSYLLKRFDPAAPRDFVFVPVGINYDRVIEDRNLIRENEGTAQRASTVATIRTTLGQVGKLFWLLARGRFHRFGYACVNFGVPISLTQYVGTLGKDFRRMGEEEYHAEVEKLGTVLMGEIARAVPVTPVALVAHAFFAAKGPRVAVTGQIQAPESPTAAMSDLLAEAEGPSVPTSELLAAADRRLAELRRRRVTVALPRTTTEDFVAFGLRCLRLRHVIHESDGTLAVATADLPLLHYHANSIAHHFDGWDEVVG